MQTRNVDSRKHEIQEYEDSNADDAGLAVPRVSDVFIVRAHITGSVAYGVAGTANQVSRHARPHPLYGTPPPLPAAPAQLFSMCALPDTSNNAATSSKRCCSKDADPFIRSLVFSDIF